METVIVFKILYAHRLLGLLCIANLKSNYDKIDNVSTIDFFEKIRSKYPESKTINVVLDQASYRRSK